MEDKKNRNSHIRILLSEGSSTNVREMITALGPSGYTIDICDPNPYCIGRFSSYVNKVYQCPRSGNDPVAYLKFVIKLIKEKGYDVLFPANEQAFLFAWAKEYLTPLAGIAVSDFSAFQRLQTKSAFMGFLDEMGLPHPLTRFAGTWDEIQESVSFFDKHCYIKTDYGTASTGVWRIGSDKDLNLLKETLNAQNLIKGKNVFLIQEVAQGTFEQLHSIFDHGRLLAIHCTRRLKEGLGGGAIIKVGVDRPMVRQNLETIGATLKWHGSLSMDYFYEEQSGSASYIDANPRITEPMNAVVNGINLAKMQVQLSRGEVLPTQYTDHITNKSHSSVQALLAAAARRYSRSDILRELYLLITGEGIYKNSSESITPVTKDFLSIFTLGAVLLKLLYNPRGGQALAQKTISDYSLGPAILQISNKKPEEYFSIDQQVQNRP